VLELEKKSCRGYGTFACAGQAAGERERVRSHDDLTLRGRGAGFNKNIQQNSSLFIGDQPRRRPRRGQTWVAAGATCGMEDKFLCGPDRAEPIFADEP
jgi:hypothetical protein